MGNSQSAEKKQDKGSGKTPTEISEIPGNSREQEKTEETDLAIDTTSSSSISHAGTPASGSVTPIDTEDGMESQDTSFSSSSSQLLSDTPSTSAFDASRDESEASLGLLEENDQGEYGNPETVEIAEDVEKGDSTKIHNGETAANSLKRSIAVADCATDATESDAVDGSAGPSSKKARVRFLDSADKEKETADEKMRSQAQKAPSFPVPNLRNADMKVLGEALWEKMRALGRVKPREYTKRPLETTISERVSLFIVKILAANLPHFPRLEYFVNPKPVPHPLRPLRAFEASSLVMAVLLVQDKNVHLDLIDRHITFLKECALRGDHKNEQRVPFKKSIEIVAASLQVKKARK